MTSRHLVSFLLLACSSEPSGEAPPRRAVIDASTVDTNVFVLPPGPPTAQAVTTNYLEAMGHGDVSAMRATLIDLASNEYYYDCSRRPDYNLPATTQSSMDNGISAGIDAWRELEKLHAKPAPGQKMKPPAGDTPAVRLIPGTWTETNREHRSEGDISGVCRVRHALDVVFGNTSFELVDRNDKRAGQFILVETGGVDRIALVTLLHD